MALLLKGCLFLQDDTRRVNVPVKLAGRVFLLRPNRNERAIGEFGESGITDGPATVFRGSIREERGFAPGLAFIARDAQVKREAMRIGAGIVGEDECSIACAKQVRGTRGAGEVGLFSRTPCLAFVGADLAPELAVLRAQDHVDLAGLRLRDGRFTTLAFGIGHCSKACPCLATIA